jgi:hypothetical protein
MFPVMSISPAIMDSASPSLLHAGDKINALLTPLDIHLCLCA